MAKWNKIDWYCSGCNEYWMTTENCAPCAQINSWCHCSCRSECKHEGKAPHGKPEGLAVPKCHVCSQELKAGDLCSHVENRSLAT